MDLVKNKASGSLFIVLDDAGGSHFLLITPEGKIKSLERRLFGPPVAMEHQERQWKGHLTPAQMDIYQSYKDKVDYLKYEN